MMRRVDKFSIASPGPEKQAPRQPALRPFVAIELPYNPWALCRQYEGAILLTHGHIWKIAQILTAGLTDDQRHFIIRQRRTFRYADGRKMKIHFREMHQGSSVVGGCIQLWNARGQYVCIQDTKSFFHMNFPKVARMYGTDDLAAIMERTRASLQEVGIKPAADSWWRCSSITDYLWRKLEVDINKVPCVSAPRGPGNLQGYHVFGHTDQPVFAYDINSAYLGVMAEFKALQPFTDYMWGARQELVQANDPAAYLIKLASTIMPGKFSSELPSCRRYYRPVLGNYIRQRVNDRLREAMNLANTIEQGPNNHNVYRWCVDGFLARTNIEHLMPIGNNLGQWKPVKKHKSLSIAKTNVWYTDREYKDGGFRVTEQQILDANKDPFEIRTTRTIFDWDLLEERTEPVTLRQPHNWMTCGKCWEEDDRELHDLFGMYI